MFRILKLAGVLGLGGLLATSTPAVAQSQPLERVTVTGSNIKRTDTETASPVQVLTREDIERTGRTSLQEVLRAVTADGQGSLSSSFSDGLAAGSAAVSLRGMGVNATLVLINGRRMTSYGLADDGTRTFIDLNTLPLDAVDRIEVLKDGGSAIYGADAVGGVVNVILRKHYTGATIGGSYGRSARGDGAVTRSFGTIGFGDLDADRYNVFVSLEASKQNNVWSRDRGFIGQSNLRSRGYYDVTNGENRDYFGLGPSSNSPYGVTRDATTGAGPVNLLSCGGNVSATTGLCLYNPLVEQEVQPRIERLNLHSRGTLQFSASMLGYVELGLFGTKTRANGPLNANTDIGVYVPGDPANPRVLHGPMLLPAAHPDNTFGVDRTLFIRPQELGGRDHRTDNQIARLVAGLEGAVAGWDYDIGATYIRSRLLERNLGYIRYDAMQAALDDGSYRISDTARTDPGVLAAISPTLASVATSSLKAIDFKALRDVFALPGGNLGVAFGAEHRWEEADTPPMPFTDTGGIVNLSYAAFSAKRRVSAVFGEVTAPVTSWLELSGALRHDRYSDFGPSTNPRLGFKLRPIDRLAVRGTYSESFRAPGPAETGGSSIVFAPYGILSQGRSGIQPETAKSTTLGLIAEPMAGSSVTVDYWRIDRRNEIVKAEPASIIPPGQCISVCDGSAGTPDLRGQRRPGAPPGSFLYYDDDGALTTLTGFFSNAATTKTDGIDVDLRHRMNLGVVGALTAQLNWTHVRSFRRTDAAGTTFEYAGTHGPQSLSAGAGTPKDKATFALTLDRGPFAITAALNYVASIKMIDHAGETTAQDLDDSTTPPTPLGTITNANTAVSYPDAGQYDCGVFDTNGTVYNGCRLPSLTTVDLYARWSPFQNLDIHLSIQNLFDRKAPFDPYLVVPYSINYNQTWHQSGAVGRFFTLGAKYSF